MDNIEVLFSEKDIEKRVKELARTLYKKYGNKEVIFICTLKGSVFFACDLLKHYKGVALMEFLRVSSYKGKESSGEVTLNLSIAKDNIENKDVVIIEDIVDTGYTLDFLVNYISGMKPSSVVVCTLLDKEAKRVIDIKPDYYGFKVDDLFVVGYGLDYNQKYRNLPYVGFITK